MENKQTKLYTFTEEQMNTLYSYLMNKPMRESEPFVLILRNPVSVVDSSTSTKTEGSNEETKN